MDQQFLEKWSFEQARINKIALSFGLEIDFRDSKYQTDLCFAYQQWPRRAYWKEVFQKVLELCQQDINDKMVLNKVKQWTNRYFDHAIKDGLILKTSAPEDKRVVVFEWTDKGLKLMKLIFEG